MSTDLQPGPFLMGNDADVAVPPGVYDFEDDAQLVSDELTAIYHDWDAFLTDLPNLAAGPLDPTLGIDDVGLLDEIANETAIAEFPDLLSLYDSLGNSADLFGAAKAFAPAAAFAPTNDVFTPPDPDATIVVPQVPISLYTPDVSGLITPAASSSGYSVTLVNQTRVGQNNFVVGDTFLVVALGPPNADVTITGTQNGVDFGTVDLGPTDASGNFQLTGVEGPDAVGQWVENWSIGGQLIATFVFVVTPSGV